MIFLHRKELSQKLVVFHMMPAMKIWEPHVERKRHGSQKEEGLIPRGACREKGHLQTVGE